MGKVTYYGYFGPSTNVKDATLDAAGVDAFAAAIGAMPRRNPVATLATLPIARDAAGRPLRFIPVSDLSGNVRHD